MLCMQCEGCGKITNDADEAPWSVFEKLAPYAVKAGFVKPVTCPACNGTGFQPIKCDQCQDIKRIQDGSRFVDCPECNHG